jgi:hypothetical protein
MSDFAVDTARIPADDWFLLAPDSLHDDILPPSDSADRLPQPRCHEHSQLIGDTRMPTPWIR